MILETILNFIECKEWKKGDKKYKKLVFQDPNDSKLWDFMINQNDNFDLKYQQEYQVTFNLLQNKNYQLYTKLLEVI